MSGETDANTKEEEQQELAERSNVVTTTTNKRRREGDVDEDVTSASVTATATDSIVDNKDDTKKVSKNALKRQAKWVRKIEVNKRRKDQEKSIKIAKAEAAGRDIAAEQEYMERGRKDGSGWAKRNGKWLERFEKSSSKHQIYLDCSFEESMTYSEINSLATQIRYCYADNKKAKNPVKVTCSRLSGETLNHLKNIMGFEQWSHRAFFHTNKDIIETNTDKSKLVYLTGDSENILTKFEDDKIYIIGGIVDRSRLKRVTIDRAEKCGITTAKLPIDDYLHLSSGKALTSNHVFEILLKYQENGGDWKKALLDVLPKKKEAIAIEKTA